MYSSVLAIHDQNASLRLQKRVVPGYWAIDDRAAPNNFDSLNFLFSHTGVRAVCLVMSAARRQDSVRWKEHGIQRKQDSGLGEGMCCSVRGRSSSYNCSFNYFFFLLNGIVRFAPARFLMARCLQSDNYSLGSQ
jgi:hypothetical protein